MLLVTSLHSHTVQHPFKSRVKSAVPKEYLLQPVCLPGIFLFKAGQNHTHVRCIYVFFGEEITKYTVIYGVHTRFWPALFLWRCKLLKAMSVSAMNIGPFTSTHCHRIRTRACRLFAHQSRNDCTRFYYHLSACCGFPPGSFHCLRFCLSSFIHHL